MNSRALAILVAVFAVLSIAFLYFFKGNQTNKQNNITLPVSQTQKGVESMNLAYNFRGKVTKIEPKGKHTLLTLDISDKGIPEFLVSDGLIFSNETNTPVKVTAGSIKIGSVVIIGMNYDLNKKIWGVTGVSILPSSPLIPAK